MMDVFMIHAKCFPQTSNMLLCCANVRWRISNIVNRNLEFRELKWKYYVMNKAKSAKVKPFYWNILTYKVFYNFRSLHLIESYSLLNSFSSFNVHIFINVRTILHQMTGMHYSPTVKKTLALIEENEWVLAKFEHFRWNIFWFLLQNKTEQVSQ